MKSRKSHPLIIGLAKLGYIAPIFLGVLSTQALAAPEDLGSSNNSVFFEKLVEIPALQAYYLSFEKSTHDIFDLNVTQALEGDILIQGDYLKLETNFDNKFTVSDSQKALLELTAKSLLIGYNFKKFSLNGHDKLVLGGFGGYGLMSQTISLITERTTETETADETDKAEAAKIYFDTESNDFVGGIYTAYQSNADKSTGLRLGAAIQYGLFSHKFAAGLDYPKDADGKKPAALIYKVGRISAKVQTAYMLKLGTIGGYPFLLTKSGQISVSKDLSDSKNTKNLTEAFQIDLKSGLQLAVNLEDKGLSPFISGDFVKKFAHQDLTGQAIEETVDLELGGGLSWQIADNLALKFKLVQSRNWKNDQTSNTEKTAVNGYKSGFGLTYLF
jgi:hypothetical protein